MLGKPPHIVPDDLSPDEYHKLGMWYHEDGQLENARISLTQAIQGAPGSDTAREARNFLDNHIPRHAVPAEVLARIKFTRLQAITNPADAAAALEQIIAECPNLEWTYKDLADIRIRNGDSKGAIDLLKSALAINEDYGPALSAMAMAQAIEMEYDQARAFLAQALAANPGDQELTRLRHSIEVAAALDLAS